jgi:hypothetical protein
MVKPSIQVLMMDQVLTGNINKMSFEYSFERGRRDLAYRTGDGKDPLKGLEATVDRPCHT